MNPELAKVIVFETIWKLQHKKKILIMTINQIQQKLVIHQKVSLTTNVQDIQLSKTMNIKRDREQ